LDIGPPKNPKSTPLHGKRSSQIKSIEIVFSSTILQDFEEPTINFGVATMLFYFCLWIFHSFNINI